MNEQMIGTIDGVIFRNEDNGYSVLHINGDDGLMFVAVGSIPAVEEGERLELNGFWIEHKTYGKQFKVLSYNVIEPTTYDEIEAYLSNGSIKGIGKTVAKLIVQKFGESTFEVLDNTPERLLEITGIGKVKYQTIINSYNLQRGARYNMLELQKLDITPAQAVKIIKAYGDAAVSIVKSNPYRLIDDIENIGFKTADKIARKAGIAFDSEFRIKAGLIYMLQWAEQEGHTYLPFESLINATVKTICVREDLVLDYYNELIQQGRLQENLINGSRTVFLPYIKRTEMNIAVRLCSLAVSQNKVAEFDFDKELQAVASNNNIELADKQREAVISMFKQGVTIITGGPGTGKTTILKTAIELMKKWGLTFELAAPTGRAAKRMTAATGQNAQTIHRLLEYSFVDKSFLRDETDPIDADFVIIDEMSMVDVFLMNALLKAVADGTRLILVGDVDQLPSVGAGNVLGDMINSGKIFFVRLTEVYRQAEQSMIISNAHKINNGIYPQLDDAESDFNFFELDDMSLIADSLVALYRDNKRGLLNTDNTFRDVQLLAPMKKSELGVINLNKRLQEAVNPPEKHKAEIQFGDTVFRVGDKVMQIKNDYSINWTKEKGDTIVEEGKGIYNGDIGVISDIDIGNKLLSVRFEDGAVAEYTHDLLIELELAYCISIHKSQGSEFKIVLMAIAGGPPTFMTRNLLYTAVTRAKSQVYIIGRRNSIYSMVTNKSTKQRYTALRFMIEEYFDNVSKQ